MTQIVDSIGLCLDILGAIFLFLFGLPAAINREGHNYLVLESTDEEMKGKAALFERFAKLGPVFLIAGFAAQLLSNFLP
jgi:hypothetical protein